jgi:GT2 family glycosyltransferase
MTPRLSVIIVTWNVEDVVVACLESVYRHAGAVVHEVVLVDNASTDGTVAAVRSRFPQVRVLANATNAGFPLANNQALRVAEGDHILFLNPDTEVSAGAVQACLHVLAEEGDVGVTGCRLELEDGSLQLECARRDFLLHHLLLEALYLHMLLPNNRICGDHRMSYWDHRGERDVEAISGAFMLARRRVVEQVGGLPAELFMYHEDLAFCLRARRAGWRIRYLGDYPVLHRWQRSSARSSAALALLEGEVKTRLIREAQGQLAGAVARWVFAARSLLRLVIGGVGSLLLGGSAVARRYPRVLDWRTHWLQLVWAVRPSHVMHLMPQPVVAAELSDVESAGVP